MPGINSLRAQSGRGVYSVTTSKSSLFASIGHRLKLDPKVTVDERGHGVGVAIQESTKTSVKDRAAAARKLEQEVLGKRTAVRMPRRKAPQWSATEYDFFGVSLTC